MERLVARSLVDGDLELLLLPWPQAVRPEEHHARLAVVQPLGQRRLELPAGGQLPFLQVQQQTLALKPLGHLVNGRAVLGVVRQERVVMLRPEGRHRGPSRRDGVGSRRPGPPCACLSRRPSISGVSMPPRCYPNDTLAKLYCSMIWCSLLAHPVGVVA